MNIQEIDWYCHKCGKGFPNNTSFEDKPLCPECKSELSDLREPGFPGSTVKITTDNGEIIVKIEDGENKDKEE